MARITSWQTLVDAIVDRMNDAAQSAYADEFIQMAETMFNRRLFNLEAEGIATIAADVSLPLPTDFVRLKSIYLDSDPRQLLTFMSADNLRQYWAAQTTGRPQNYTLSGDDIILGPSPDSAYTVTMAYVRTLTPLTSTATTNWLLEKHPDLYLYGALAEAEARGWNNEQAVFYSDRVESAINEINNLGNMRRTGGGMRMRSPTVEVI